MEKGHGGKEMQKEVDLLSKLMGQASSQAHNRTLFAQLRELYLTIYAITLSVLTPVAIGLSSWVEMLFKSLLEGCRDVIATLVFQGTKFWNKDSTVSLHVLGIRTRGRAELQNSDPVSILHFYFFTGFKVKQFLMLA